MARRAYGAPIGALMRPDRSYSTTTAAKALPLTNLPEINSFLYRTVPADPERNR